VVAHLQETFAVSQRRACRLIGQARSTQRQTPKRNECEAILVRRILELVGERPRFGYRRIGVLLRAEGWRVNLKRVYRLWRQQGLKVPQKRRKRRQAGPGAGCGRQRAERIDHVWAWDFIHDRTVDGRPLKWLSIIDEFTRECLALEVGRRFASPEVLEVLSGLFRSRGAPSNLRSDNGSEFIAKAIRAWLRRAGVATWYIEPGAPWENGYAESFHSRLRDEFLAGEEFTSVLEARVLGKQWLRDYNEVRPHSALAYRTPAEFASACRTCCSATLRSTYDTPLERTSPTEIVIASGT
jgi:putative transposase